MGPAAGPAGAGNAPRVTPTEVQVNVYNATQRTGLARSVAVQLKRRGFAIKEIDNDPQRKRITGTAIIRYGAGGATAAKLLATQVPMVKLARDKRRAPAIDLVLGEGFTTLGPAAPGCDTER
jgi:LytR cell envelope-related transcriptional attenuator